MECSIIIVDDDSVFLESIQRVLNISGYKNISIYQDSLEAAHLVEKGKNVDLEVMERMARTFRGNFIGFAIWFN